MSEKFILLECNRLRSMQNYNFNEEQDVYKNRWTNNVNSYGIVINPGDLITCESSAINTIGASDDTIEFTGEVNKAGFTDNKCDITFGYYVCDSGHNLIKLPLRQTTTFYMPTGGDSHSDNGVNKAALRNRSIGEPFLMNWNTNREPYDPPGAGVHIEWAYVNDEELPGGHLVMYYELSTTTSAGEGYRVDGIYHCTGGAGTGMTFKVLSVNNETGANGIPSKIQMWNQGTGYSPSGDVVILSTAADGGSAPKAGSLQSINLFSYVNGNFASKTAYGPDGRRYFFADNNFTGSCLMLYTGIPNSVHTGQTTAKLNPIFNMRTVKINYELPLGLNTPDNIGTILTDQMHRPQRYTLQTKTKYFDYSKYQVLSVNQKDQTEYRKPPIISTPSYQPMPTNGQALSFPYNKFNSLDGARLQYYSNVCYDDPARIAGLSIFRQFAYNMTNYDKINQINSGYEQANNMGDFGNQMVGNCGLIPVLLMTIPDMQSLPGYNAQNVKIYDRGELMMTNIYFTETNIQAISTGFRLAEKYWGSTNIEYDIDSQYYKDNIAVALDLGLYIDEISTAYPLNGTNTPDFKDFLPNQRWRFKGMHEALRSVQPTLIRTPVDNGAQTEVYDPAFCLGSQPFGWQKHYDGNPNNDGQQLSSLVVTTNYADTQLYDSDTDQTNSIFQRLHQHCIDQHTADATKFGFINGAWSVNQMFNGEYTDTLDNKTYNTLSLAAMAKKYNLWATPVWANGADAEWSQFGGRPYIAFRSHLQLNVSPAYDTRLNGISNNWQIDSRNCPYGIQLGYDSSFIRNNAALLYNTEYSAKYDFDKPDTFNAVVMMGAVNPNVSFDENLSRFTISGLNTPMTIGNGLPTMNAENNDPNPNPEQQVYNVNTPGQIGMVRTNNAGQPITMDGNYITGIEKNILNEDVPQEAQSLIDSYSGLAIISVSLYDINNASQDLLYTGLYGNNAFDKTDQYYYKFPRNILKDTLFGKMGFNIDQLMPEFGSTQAFFINPLSFETSATTFYDKYATSPLPQITAAYISSAEYQPTSTNRLDMPLYGIGTNGGLASQPSVQQANIAAQDLPTKLDYPYLLIYSSILSGGTDTEYYGGYDGKSLLPCIGYITRNYNSGDFFYGLLQDFSYTATKTFTLTEIETEIRLPDGSRPRLSTHNSVIYKITKPGFVPAGELPKQKIKIKKIIR